MSRASREPGQCCVWQANAPAPLVFAIARGSWEATR